MIAKRSIAEIVGLGLSVIATVVLSRSLGPGMFGYYAAVAVISQIGMIIGGLGLAQVGSIVVARDHLAPERAVPLVCLPRFATGAALWVATLAACAVGVLGPTLSPMLAVASFGWLFSGLRLEWLFVARGDLGFVSALRVAGALGLICAAVFAAISRDAFAVGTVIVAPIAVPAIVGIVRIYATRDGSISWLIPTIGDVHAALRSGVHFLRGEIGTFITMSSDRLFLLVLTTPVVLGLYDAAYRVILPFYSVAAIVNDASFAGLASSGRREAMRAYSLRTLTFTVPVGFVLTLMAGPIIGLLYGAEFAAATNYLIVLGWVITVGFMSGVVVFPLAARGRDRAYGTAVMAGSIACLLGNVVLIPPLAGLGAALSTIVGKAASAAAGYRSYIRETSYPIGSDVLRTLAASAAATIPAAACLAILGQHFWLLALAIFGLGYVTAGIGVFGYRGLRAALADEGGRAKSSSML